MSLSLNLAANVPKLAGRDERVTSVSALFFLSRTIWFSEMSLLCPQSVFETKILILQPSPVLRKIVCVCVHCLLIS